MDRVETSRQPEQNDAVIDPVVAITDVKLGEEVSSSPSVEEMDRVETSRQPEQNDAVIDPAVAITDVKLGEEVSSSPSVEEMDCVETSRQPEPENNEEVILGEPEPENNDGARDKEVAIADFILGEQVYYAGSERVESNCRLSYGQSGKVNAVACKNGEIDVCFEDLEESVTIEASMLTRAKPTTKLVAGFQVGDEVFYLGKSMKWPSGDKISVGSHGITKGPGESDPNQIDVLFDGNNLTVSVDPGLIMPANPDWTPHGLVVQGRPGGA